MNFPNPTQEEIVALARLTNNQDWKTVQDYLAKLLQHQDVDNRTLKDTLLLQGQGVAQTLQHILDTAANARNIATKIRDRAAEKP